MRTPIISLLATLAVAACSSGTRTIIVREPAPAQPPVHQSVDPLELTIGRPVTGRLLFQTNRPAYVAIFEIVPDHGVTLVYPTSPAKARYMTSGLSWVPIWWRGERGLVGRAAGAHGAPNHPARLERYIYAIASDEPLRIPHAAWTPGNLQAELGSRAYRAINPYGTMRTIARRFLPPVVEEEWAEDVYAHTTTYVRESERIVRVYCPGGRVYEVSADMADRVWCPAVPRHGDHPTVRRPAVRPDSVLGESGRRLPVLPRRRGMLGRVTEQMVDAHGNGRGPADERDRVGNQGNGRGQGRPEDVGPHGRDHATPRRDTVQVPDRMRPRDDVRENPVPLPGRGNAGNGNNGTGNDGSNGAARDSAERGNPGRGMIGRVLGGVRNGNNGNGGNPGAGNPGKGNDNGRGNAGTDPRGEQRTDPRPEPRSDVKPEPQSDAKGGKPDDKGQQPDEMKPKADDRGQKPEDKGQTTDDRPNRSQKAEPVPTKADDRPAKPEHESHGNGRSAKHDNPRPDSRAEPKQEAKETQAESRPAPRTEPKTEPNTEPETKTEAKSDNGHGKGAEKGAEQAAHKGPDKGSEPAKPHGKPDSSDEQKGARKGKP